jgi:hypothetical protein
MSWREKHLVQVCPFCGRWGASYDGAEDDGFVWSFVSCYYCDAQGPDIRGYNEIRATEAWNIRGGPPEVLAKERRGYTKEPESKIQESFSLKPCPFCSSRRLEIHEDSILCDNCGAFGPGHLNRDQEKEAVTLSTQDLTKAYWNERSAPSGHPDEKSWTHHYAQASIEGILEAVEKKNDLEFLRIRETDGTVVHLLMGDMPEDPDWIKTHIGWEVRFRIQFEPLTTPEDLKKSTEESKEEA